MNAPIDNPTLTNFEQRLRESQRFHMQSGKVHETLRALAAHLDDLGIDYAVVGGMALNAHGYSRETIDVDVLVTRDGLQRFRDALLGKGYRLAFEGATKSYRNTRTGVPVEFLTAGEFPGDGKPKPVAFPDPAAVAVSAAGIKVVNLTTLIELKLASGMTQPSRRRDLADVQDLVRVLGLDASLAEQLDPFVRPTYRMLLDELSSDDPHAEC